MKSTTPPCTNLSARLPTAPPIIIPKAAQSQRLRRGIKDYRVCLLCSEEDPARCHRALLVARELVKESVEVRRIRADVCIVMSSGYGEEEVIGRFRGKGISGFVPKPYDTATLVAEVMQAMGRHPSPTPARH